MIEVNSINFEVHQISKYTTTVSRHSDIESLIIENQLPIIFITDESNKIQGCLSKGDILKKRGVNQNPFKLVLGKSLSPEQKKRISNYNQIPVVDEKDKIVKVLVKSKKSKNSIVIKEEEFSPFKNILTIAEIGNNHNGSVERGFRLIKSALKAGVRAVKFQARNLQECYINTSEEFLNQTDYGTAYTVKQLKSFNLDYTDLQLLFKEVRNLGGILICTAFDVPSAKFIIENRVDAIKIASADMLNFDLLDIFNKSAIPLIISTGMHSESEIAELKKYLERNFIEAVLLHVNSTYPTPFEDVHLNYMPKLASMSSTGLFGYSGHERGFHIPLVATSMGAVIIEKHFTDNRSDIGNDHKVSLLENEFASMCSQINQIIDAMGSKSTTKEVSQGERLNRIPLAKGLYYTKDLLKGHIITKNDFKLVSPCVGLEAKELNSYLGKAILSDVKKDAPAILSHFSNSSINLNHQFLGNFGLPVRFRDIKEIKEAFKPSFIEYHMFASDLQVDPNKYKDLFDGFELSIHAPEQFDDGFVLDLVSDDRDTFLESFKRFKNVLSWVNNLQELNNTHEIKLITNVGGATNNPEDRYSLNKKLAYEKLAEVADFAKASGVELLPQTMPPYPWHFGGQGFHRLFMDLKDLKDMQSYYPMFFCMDVSHTWMSMAELGLDFYEEIFKYQEYFKYYHIADAKHPTDEGVQIGLGEIEFDRISNLFKQKSAQYIPEVWNGHLDNFKGFKEALKKLENL